MTQSPESRQAKALELWHGMNPMRYAKLQQEGGVLTEAEIKDGWHYCRDWDFMLIHKHDIENEGCSCPKTLAAKK